MEKKEKTTIKNLFSWEFSRMWGAERGYGMVCIIHYIIYLVYQISNYNIIPGPRKGYTQRNPRTGAMELDRVGKELSTWGWFKKQAPDIAKHIKAWRQ